MHDEPLRCPVAAKADWSPLHGRTVVIWPDNDAAGAKYAADVARLVPGAKIVPVPASFPDKWDLADELPEGITLEALGGLLLLAEAPKVKAKKPSKDDLRKTAEEAKRERDGVIAKIRGLISKTVANGATEAEADSAFNKARQLMEEHSIQEEELREPVDEPEPTFDDLGADIDGDALLDSVHSFLLAVCFLSVAACIRRSYLVDCSHTHDEHLGQLAANCLHVAGARIRQDARA